MPFMAQNRTIVMSFSFALFSQEKLVSSPRNNADGLRVAVVAAVNKSYNKASRQGFGLYSPLTMQ